MQAEMDFVQKKKKGINLFYEMSLFYVELSVLKFSQWETYVIIIMKNYGNQIILKQWLNVWFLEPDILWFQHYIIDFEQFF